jgi:hypothetical protein
MASKFGLMGQILHACITLCSYRLTFLGDLLQLHQCVNPLADIPDASWLVFPVSGLHRFGWEYALTYIKLLGLDVVFGLKDWHCSRVSISVSDYSSTSLYIFPHFYISHVFMMDMHPALRNHRVSGSK